MKSKTLLPTLMLLWILTVLIMVPMVQPTPGTYGPRLDELYGRFIESPAAQKAALYAGEVDYWPYVGNPQIVRELQDEDFAMVATPETFLYYRIDFNVRDQLNPSGGSDPWRTAGASEVDRVILEGYTGGLYDEDVDFDIFTRDLNWLGSLYATGAPGWVTPRWVGTSNASDMEPSLKTGAGINNLEVLVYFYDPLGHGGPGNILDCLRLKVEFKDDRAPEYLYVDDFSATRVEWTAVGASPFLDAPGDGNYIEGTTDGAWMCWFSFADIDLGGYYSYSGAPYTNYVPLDDQAFRHAVAHLIPKEEIVAVVYEGISAEVEDSLVPEAQKKWCNPDVDGHPHSRAEAISILEAAGYEWDPEAPNPAPPHSPDDPVGNWIDPATGEAMNHITFAGVTQALSPDSWARDDMCAREFRAIGLPIEHVEVDYGYLTDIMMDYHQFDMYAAGWRVGRFPDHLCGFFHSSQDVIEGYNFPGVSDTELDGYLRTLQYETDPGLVKTACFNAQDRLAQLCISIPIVTRPIITASATARAPGHTDTLLGIVNSPGYGSTNDWTFYDLHWASNVDPVNNPLGIGGTMNYIVPSAPTNYHPGYASTTDEWMVLSRVFDPLIQVDPYTHEDIPWLATAWAVEPWIDPASGNLGMKTTFWLRDDIYWHDGVHYNAYSAKWSLEFARDQQIVRALPMWQHLVDVEVHDTYSFSVYHDATSLWTLSHIAGPDVWLIHDAACWATMFPEHIYAGTDRYFRPEQTVNPINPSLTCLIGTGPYVYLESDLYLGGYVQLKAYRPGPSPVSTHWFMSVEGEAQLLREMFHWIGDVNRDGIIDAFDLGRINASFGSKVGDPRYDADADIAPEPTYHTNDGQVNIHDASEVSKNWGKSWKYPLLPEDLVPRLIETIDTLNLPQGTENSLTSQIEQALNLYDNGNENGAIHKLMDFMDKVEAQRGKKITEAQADHLIEEAQKIIDLI